MIALTVAAAACLLSGTVGLLLGILAAAGHLDELEAELGREREDNRRLRARLARATGHPAGSRLRVVPGQRGPR